jgi:transcriptional regulator
MYLPEHFEETDLTVLHQLVGAYPLGALVASTRNGLEANHIPFLARPEPQPCGSLRGHIARANPLWHDLEPEQQVLVIFQGPQSFISPSWYPSKKETQKVVPTWNYAVVHARGHIRVIDDPLWVRAHVEELTDRHEAQRPVPWKVSDAPADFIEKMIAAIVGLEISITTLEGKWKVSQNRLPKDRMGVIEGLGQEGTDAAAAMANLVRQALSSTRGPK